MGITQSILAWVSVPIAWTAGGYALWVIAGVAREEHRKGIAALRKAKEVGMAVHVSQWNKGSDWND